MAQITDLSPTNALTDSDELVLRQGTTDKRIRIELANMLSWAKRNDYTYLGSHESGVEYTNAEEFTEYLGRAYFVKSGVTLPYTSNSADPSTDINLTTTTPSDTTAFKEIIDSIHGIGDTLLKFDDTDPNVKYPWQLWELVTGAATLSLGDGTTQTGLVTGTNSVTLKEGNLPLHDHEAGGLSFSGITQQGTFEIAAEFHEDLTSGVFTSQRAGTHDRDDGHNSSGNTVTTFSMTPSGTIGGSTGSTGFGNPFSIQSASVKVNVWKRTA